MYTKTLIKLAKRTKLLEGKGCEDYEMKCKHCPLYSLSNENYYNLICKEALEKYINTKLEPEDKLEFLIAVYN